MQMLLKSFSKKLRQKLQPHIYHLVTSALQVMIKWRQKLLIWMEHPTKSYICNCDELLKRHC